MTPGQRGRQIGRGMIALAVVVGVCLPAYLFVATAAGPTPMFNQPPADLFGVVPVGAVPLIGMVGIVVGLVWMVRIHRADPEPDQHAWRYRARR